MSTRDRHAEIRVLDAMQVLDRFTLADLQRYSSASPKATETVVRRWRRVLETVGKRPARTGSGRPQTEYRVTDAGEAELAREFSRLPRAMAAPATSLVDIPGLGLARHILAAELLGANSEQRRALVSEAESSFASARRRLRPDSDASLLEESGVVDFLFDLVHLEDALATDAVTDVVLPKVRASRRQLPNDLGRNYPDVLKRISASPASDLLDPRKPMIPNHIAIVNLGVGRAAVDRVRSAVRLLGLTPHVLRPRQVGHWFAPDTAPLRPVCVMVTYNSDVVSRLDDLVSNTPPRSPMVVLCDRWNRQLQKRAIEAGARFVCLTGLDRHDLANALDVERDPYLMWTQRLTGVSELLSGTVSAGAAPPHLAPAQVELDPAQREERSPTTRPIGSRPRQEHQGHTPGTHDAVAEWFRDPAARVGLAATGLVPAGWVLLATSSADGEAPLHPTFGQSVIEMHRVATPSKVETPTVRSGPVYTMAAV
jgi:hypothetical protein